MKRCPECRRDYYDDTLLYCLDDGNPLLEGPASGGSPTQVLPESRASLAEDKDTRLFEDGKTTETDRGSSSAEYLIGEIRKHKAGMFIACVIAAALITGGVLAYYKYYGTGERTLAFQNFTVNRVTTSGKALEATISRDGKYIVYLEMGDDGNRSLWVRQTATGNAIPIVPATKGNVLKGTTFSPDGNFVYYLFTDRTKPNSLYQVSSLGGTPKKILDVCDSAVTISPDGRKMAFVKYEDPSKSTIYTVNVDGTEGRPLASLDGIDWFTDAGPDWSPDGKTIAVAAGNTTNGVDSMKLVGIDVQTGVLRELSPKRWVDAARVVWMPDERSLVLMAHERAEESGMQAWRVSYPSGEATRITNDVLDRDDTSLGVTADGRTLLTVTVQRQSRIETVPVAGNGTSLERLSTSDSNQDGRHGIALTRDNRVVFSSFEGGQSDLWTMNIDGSERRRLTSDSHFDADPAVSPDGRYIVFRSNRPGGEAVTRLWRMDADGGNIVQLAAIAWTSPSISADGKWVIFTAWNPAENIQSLWKVGIDGGEPVRVADYAIGQSAYSPDGQWIGGYFSDKKAGKWQYGILPASGGPTVRQFDFPGFQYEWVRWTPDSRNLSYIGVPPDPSNIWLQPSEGGQPKQLTNFESDYIFRHDWSADGKTLVLVRGRPAHDIVLLKDER